MKPIDPLDAARRHFAPRDEAAYLVGGRLRDALLGRRAAGEPDTDLAVPSGALDHARAIAGETGGTFVPLDPERDMARVVWPGDGHAHPTLDLARFVGPDIESDLGARDFTVNALALPLAASLPPDPAAVLDPTGGLIDLDRRRVRMTSAAALDADPLRLVRAVRFSAELGFDITHDTREAIRTRALESRRPAAERVREELLRIVAADRCAEHVTDMDALGLLGALVPEVTACRGVGPVAAPAHDVLDHTLCVVSALERVQSVIDGRAPDPPFPPAWSAVLERYRGELHDQLWGQRLGGHPRAVFQRLAALLHDVGKASTGTVGETPSRDGDLEHARVGARLARSTTERLRCGTRETEYVGTVVRYHPRPLAMARAGGASRRAIYRLYDAAGPAGVDVALFALADNADKLTTRGEREVVLATVVSRLLEAWFERRGEWVAPAPLITGDELIDRLGLMPGPEVGRLLGLLREAQASGEIADRDEALALARTALEGS